MIRYTSFVLAALLSLVVLTGCSESAPAGPEQLKTVPAGGIVTYRNSPIGNASVSLQRVDGKATASGKTTADGKFVLSTYGENDGAPAGEYVAIVSVSGAQEIEPGVLAPEPPGGFVSPIPLQYGDPTTSGLRITIPEGGDQNIALSLQ